MLTVIFGTGRGLKEECKCVREAREEQRQRDCVEQQMIGWIRRAKNKAKVQFVSKPNKRKANWHRLPRELVDTILGLALVEDARIHELILDSSHRMRQHRGANRVVLRSNNYAFVPKMLHVCREWRERALREYQLCKRTPQWPHPNWQIGQPCLKIKPFWFNPKMDTLYFGYRTGEWLGYFWARTDTFWINGLLQGWEHVGLDVRASSWMGHTNFLPQATGTVFTRPPAYQLRQMIPSLKRLSIVDDHSVLNCPMPISNNISFKSWTTPLPQDGRVFRGLPGPGRWKQYLETEYSAAEMPEVDLQEVARKKEEGTFWDPWMRFYIYPDRAHND